MKPARLVSAGCRLASQLTLCAALLSIGVACTSTPPLANSYNSPEALASALLDAIARNDRASLDLMALNETEFRDHVWPDLPAARPERNLPFSYVWGDLHQKSDFRLSSTLKEFGGQQFRLDSVTFKGQTAYPSYLVHRDTTFAVRDSNGAQKSLRVCGSLIEKDGMWKVFSYVVD